MSDHPLNPDPTPVRSGQIRVSTKCWYCDKTFTNPSRAAKHIRTHPKPEGKGGKNWAKTDDDSRGIHRGIRFRASEPGHLSPESERQRLLAIAWPGRVLRICAWCGRNVTKDRASVHHLIPRDWGGTDAGTNLALVHVGQCHDLIELWTVEMDRAPKWDEFGRLAASYGNTLAEGVGTIPQTRSRRRVPEPEMGVGSLPQILNYLAWFDDLNRRYASVSRP